MKTIKDIAEQLNISAHTIRFYEKKGMLNIPRDKNGNREFNEETIDYLHGIINYRNVGMSLEDIKNVMGNFFNHELSLKILNETKKELETKILELENTKKYLEMKIEIHKELYELEKKGLDEKSQIEVYKSLRDCFKK